jgi:hypothetical protein
MLEIVVLEFLKVLYTNLAVACSITNTKLTQKKYKKKKCRDNIKIVFYKNCDTHSEKNGALVRISDE